MASVIGVMGESGSGKTTACRNLDNKSTYYIDADGKGLSWSGWQKQYNKELKNYYRSNGKSVKTKDGIVSIVNVIRSIIEGVATTRPEIKIIIVDTVNGVMLDEEMNRVKEKGFDKWQDMASYIYDLIRDSHGYRDDLTIVFMFHVQDEVDDNGTHFYRILTNGRKLNKIKLETKLTNLFFAKRKEKEYVFETQANNSTAKSYMGLLPEEIENDLALIIPEIKKFEKGE